MKLLLALGVRKGELLGAQWSEFDLDAASPIRRLPASRTKTSEALTIPPVPAVASWLKSLREVAGGSAFVLPKRRRDPRQRALHLGFDTLNAALAVVEHGLPHFTLHDPRTVIGGRRLGVETGHVGDAQSPSSFSCASCDLR